MNSHLTQNFFVPDSKTDEGRLLRTRKWEKIVNDQFDIAYIMKIPFGDIGDLAVFEREYISNRLNQVLDDRKKALENNKVSGQKSKEPKYRKNTNF